MKQQPEKKLKSYKITSSAPAAARRQPTSAAGSDSKKGKQANTKASAARRASQKEPDLRRAQAAYQTTNPQQAAGYRAAQQAAGYRTAQQAASRAAQQAASRAAQQAASRAAQQASGQRKTNGENHTAIPRQTYTRPQQSYSPAASGPVDPRVYRTQANASSYSGTRPRYYIAEDGTVHPWPTPQTAPNPAADRRARQKRAEKRRQAEIARKKKQRIAWLLSILGALLLAYLLLCWTPWRQLTPTGPLDNFQEFFIRNSRESHSFQWVQYFFPSYIRQPYIKEEELARAQQAEFNTNIDPASIVLTPPADGEPIISYEIVIPEEVKETITPEQLAFYETFYQLDVNTAELYFKRHPEALANGYEGIRINEAGLDQAGTEILTTSGEQVLAIDAVNGILLVRVSGPRYRGVLAIAKDPTRLHLYTSEGIATSEEAQGYGQTAGTIASLHNGVLAITGSGFIDEYGVGTGGALVGFCRSEGRDYGTHRYWGSKRLELRKDHWLYVTEANSDCRDDVTDAMEFEPALIVDGQRLENYVYTGENPRACVGQTDRGEILMLAIEGRLSDSAGCSVGVCTTILQRYRCINAMNMDGGTSAMLWYDGAPVIRCSNTNTPLGRYLPNAWVYAYRD